jgi:uncharacterized protein
VYADRCRFRFFGDLNDFLPPAQRGRWIDYLLDGTVAVKHPIESLGVPHPEVEQILVNGGAVTFAHRLQDGELVRVFPQDCVLAVEDPAPLRPPLHHPIRFVLDTHLGRLAAYLRMLGLDAVYRNDYDDAALASIAHKERRVLLTRDRGLLKRKIVVYGYCIRQTKPRVQLIDVMVRYDLVQDVRPWRRCLRCNGLLEPVDKAEILHLLEPKTKRYYDEFWRCRSCGQVYWQGSHRDRMQNFISGVLEEVRRYSQPSDTQPTIGR